MNVDNLLRHAPRTTRPQHDEQLVDEAIEFTFPASDPVSPAQPGSIVNLRYAASDRRRRAVAMRDVHTTLRWLVPGCALVVAVLLVARRSARRRA